VRNHRLAVLVTMTPLDLARRIRDRLAAPERCAKSASARRADGRPCTPDHPDAAQWCLIGAAWAETLNLGRHDNCTELRFAVYGACFPDIEPLLLGVTVTRFSDDASHAELLAKIDEGIARLEGRALGTPA